MISPPLADNSTYGNTNQIHTTHVHLDLFVNFDDRQLMGNATHNMNVIEDTDTIQFDAWDLTFYSVFNVTSGEEWAFTVEQPNPAIGSVLVVTMPRVAKAGETVDVKVMY